MSLRTPTRPTEPFDGLSLDGTLAHMTDSHEREHAFAEQLVDTRRRQSSGLPQKQHVAAFIDGLLGLLFPQLAEEEAATSEEIQARLSLLRRDLRALIEPLAGADRAGEAARAFGDLVPDLYTSIRLDAEAIVAGDPAAESVDEVVVAYPGFHAIATYRIAHAIHGLGIPVLPRLMSEVAHTRTGVDIHPGATIGRSFCIDHGTGVVIGETATIGDWVKVYQGVTLGAMSVAKSNAGKKRHPTIEDRVVLYSSATVLGGDTVVGHDSVVGGNVWLTNSVPPYSLVYHTSQVKVRSVSDGFADADYVI